MLVTSVPALKATTAASRLRLPLLAVLALISLTQGQGLSKSASNATLACTAAALARLRQRASVNKATSAQQAPLHPRVRFARSGTTVLEAQAQSGNVQLGSIRTRKAHTSASHAQLEAIAREEIRRSVLRAPIALHLEIPFHSSLIFL